MSAGTKSVKANRLTPVESYQYDAGGRRVATASGTNVVRHVYDGMHVVADTDAAGNLLRSYTWGPGIDKLLSVTVYGGTATNTYQAISDHLGTVHALVTPGGTVAERYEYDAWGNVMGVFDGNGGSLPSSVLGLRYLFQGREYSWATHAAWGGAGLYYFRARYYDPSTGRWLSNDPIGISGGLNQYAFCANNPVMFVDPEGKLLGYVIAGGLALTAAIMMTADITIDRPDDGNLDSAKMQYLVIFIDSEDLSKEHPTIAKAIYRHEQFHLRRAWQFWKSQLQKEIEAHENELEYLHERMGASCDTSEKDAISQRISVIEQLLANGGEGMKMYVQ